VGTVSRTSWVIAAVFALGSLFAVAVGGAYTAVRAWPEAAGAYTLAGLCILGAARESSRNRQLPGYYTDDVDDTAPTDTIGNPYPPPLRSPGPLTRIRSVREIRRVRKGTCRCDRFWTSLGTAHDDWCPLSRGAQT
jgi:hypothetical protein